MGRGVLFIVQGYHFGTAIKKALAKSSDNIQTFSLLSPPVPKLKRQLRLCNYQNCSHSNTASNPVPVYIKTKYRCSYAQYGTHILFGTTIMEKYCDRAEQTDLNSSTSFRFRQAKDSTASRAD